MSAKRARLNCNILSNQAFKAYDMPITTLERRTQIDEEARKDNETRSGKPSHSRQTQQSARAITKSDAHGDIGLQHGQLYDPPQTTSLQSKRRQSSPPEENHQDQFDQADDKDDNDSLKSLEQSQLGEDSNVPFMIDLSSTKAQARELPTKSQLHKYIDAIRNTMPSVDGLRQWFWGNQYDRLLPDQVESRANGPGWRKLEGKEYESVAVEFEYREGRGSGNGNGKAG
ncbi:hypothetical protein PRZ48_011866 [Zasmidium cellare]|uniref:Uncharacterized protein n=1 Tax=Zasmidium cellare TaxID=395010 RepID=A0ABR0E7S2_ZASCE|nr:hypothetical protein PRZ48_011866 [Zasmidium cellare]